MLWICLYFPDLPLQVFSRASNASGPVVVSTMGRAPEALACNNAALEAGIFPAMSISAAYALAPDLQVCLRNTALEARALAGVALWAGRFTPVVSLAEPFAVLLEIGGCLKYFHGLPLLLDAVRTGLEALGYSAVIATAPVAAGALLLSRAGQSTQITEIHQLAAHLAALPIGALDHPSIDLQKLAAMGINTIGDCLGLPREGLARRFGQRLLDALDRALGRLPDPRPPFISPEWFVSRLELIAPVWEVEALLFGLKRLVAELCGWLAGRGAGVTRMVVELQHEKNSPTRVAVGLTASRAADHMLLLLRERLSRTELPSGAVAIGLESVETVPLAPRNLSLFKDPEKEKQDYSALVEKLRARLGDEAICGLKLCAEHRPELAWCYGEPGDTDPLRLVIPPRPLWLLPQPCPLTGSCTALESPLTLLSDPERIESGWWDGADVTRDYFVAADSGGARLWVFRERRDPTRWFLHGVFA
jgi:protein ImuB